jgi:hypothetical protein
MDQQGGKITLHWVPGHVSITSNENADTAAKEVLINITTEIKERKPHIRSNKYQTRIPLLWSIIDDRPHHMAM